MPIPYGHTGVLQHYIIALHMYTTQISKTLDVSLLQQSVRQSRSKGTAPDSSQALQVNNQYVFQIPTSQCSVVAILHQVDLSIMDIILSLSSDAKLTIEYLTNFELAQMEADCASVKSTLSIPRVSTRLISTVIRTLGYQLLSNRLTKLSSCIRGHSLRSRCWHVAGWQQIFPEELSFEDFANEIPDSQQLGTGQTAIAVITWLQKCIDIPTPLCVYPT